MVLQYIFGGAEESRGMRGSVVAQDFIHHGIFSGPREGDIA